MTWEELNELGEGATVILDGQIDSRYFDGESATINRISDDDVYLLITSGEYVGEFWWACQDFHNIHPTERVNRPIVKEKKGLCAFLKQYH